MKYNKLFFTIFISCFLSVFILTESKAQVIIQNFDNAVDTFFPNPSTSGVFFFSNPAAVFELSNYAADSYEGSGSMRIDYSVGYDAGGGWAVRTTYDAFSTNTSLPYIDLSSGKSLSLWYKVVEPAILTESGTLIFEFKIAEFNDAGQRDVWQYVTTLNLTDNSGNWKQIQIPLRQDADNTKGFDFQFGNGDGVLQLDKIKGFEIAISYQTTDLSANTPIAAGTLLLDDLQLMGSHDIYTVNTKTGNSERVTFIADADEYNPTFLKNGKKVAYDVVRTSDPNGQSIYITDLRSGVSSPLAGGEGGNDASWSPNGKYIAFDRFPGDPNIYIVPARGGTPKLVRENAVDVEWSKDSKYLVFRDVTDNSIRTLNIKKGRENTIVAQGFNPVFSKKEEIVYSDGNNLFKVRFKKDDKHHDRNGDDDEDGHHGRHDGTPQQLTFDDPSVFNQQPSVSKDGKSIVFHSNRETGDFDIWRLDKRGNISRLTGFADIGDYDPTFSKKGKYIAYSGFTPVGSSLPKSNFDSEEAYTEAEATMPINYTLNQNYPNPFNPSTSISYSIPNDGLVSLTIYDALGSEVAVLDNGFKTAGTYSYQFDASNLSSGMYFYTIKSGKFVQTRKMLLMK